jgi:hypothetical protein
MQYTTSSTYKKPPALGAFTVFLECCLFSLVSRQLFGKSLYKSLLNVVRASALCWLPNFLHELASRLDTSTTSTHHHLFIRTQDVPTKGLSGTALLLTDDF